MKKMIKSLVLGCCLFVATAFQATASETTAQKPTPDATIKMLQEGNARFVANKPAHPHSGSDRVALASKEDQGNYAYATVISCSDSRVPVEQIFDAGIMDIFVVRVAGNVIDTDEAGSIEYGLAHVHTPVLVVLGHTQCGAVTAVAGEIEGHGHALERNIPPLVDNIIPAVKKAMADHPDKHGKDLVPYGVEENVWQGIENLFMTSPASREMVESGKAKVVGAIYDVATGKINWLPETKVTEILQKVEKNPARAMNAMAESEHSGHEGH